MSLLEQLEFRDMGPDDYNLILDSWIKTFQKSPWSGMVAADEYHATTRNLIDQLLVRGAKVSVLVNKADAEQIIGWVCFERSVSGTSVIHYVFVKNRPMADGKTSSFRQKGLGKACVLHACEGKPFISTFRTRDGDRLTRNVNARWVKHIATRKHLEPIRRIEGEL